MTSPRRATASGGTRAASVRAARPILIIAMLLGLVACGPATLPPGDSIADASEAQNREVHRFNVALDGAVVEPLAEAYGAAVPRPVRTGIGNVASNLNQPGYVLNNLLQFRIDDALQNTLRFAINSTIGIAGIFDPATAMGLAEAETDFGETLHVYGLGEGDYHVFPVLGPSTVRDSVGWIVDVALNPARHLAHPPSTRVGAQALAGLGTRLDLAGTIDGINDAEDSYAAARSLYLQNRRFELQGEGSDALFDPYADPYADPYSDPYGGAGPPDPAIQ
ncbi:MAG: VacJ family lipoprotein [Roseicyclus sp.]